VAKASISFSLSRFALGQRSPMSRSLRFVFKACKVLVSNSESSAQIVPLTVNRAAAWTSPRCALDVLNRKTTNCAASPTATPPQNYTPRKNPRFSRF
jgi:hypothetical protein